MGTHTIERLETKAERVPAPETAERASVGARNVFLFLCKVLRKYSATTSSVFNAHALRNCYFPT